MNAHIFVKGAFLCLVSVVWLSCGNLDDEAWSGDDELSTLAFVVGTYEAEDYSFQSGCSVGKVQPGYTGTGYMDFGGNGSLVEWNTVNVTAAGVYTLKFHYANGSWGKRRCSLTVNDNDVSGEVEFDSTGAWSTWKLTAVNARLRAGKNKIRLTATTATGGPNLDRMVVIGVDSITTGLAAKDFVGHYERIPATNSWHKVDITLENDKLWWKNAAGVRWSLELAGGVLKSGADSPYGAKVIEVQKQSDSDTVKALEFNRELYYKDVDVNVDTTVSDYYGTNVPSYLNAPSGSFERFDPKIKFFGGLDGLVHTPTAEQGAGKFRFNRIWRSSKHITGTEEYGHFHSWIQSYGNNSIEGGVGYNSAGGPHYYPQLHLSGIGSTYHPCNDLGAGHGLYYNVLGDKWLSMIQISNRVLHIPGSNVAFDKDQKPFAEDNGIWIGWGWTYLNLNHPKKYKYWMSFVESYDYQGPIVAYIPEHFNWVDPNPKKGDSYLDRKEKYEKDNRPFGTFADLGSKPNSVVSNEMYLWGTHVKNDIYYVPVPRVPSHKQREYVIANVQSITSDVMEAYSEKIRANQSFNSLIPASFVPFTSKFTTPSLKITETVGSIKHFTVVDPPYTVGHDRYKGFVEWPATSSGVIAQAKGAQNGYLYYRKLSGTWDLINEDDHLYKSLLVRPPDNVQRVPNVRTTYHNYPERDTQNPEFANWDVTGMPRYKTLLQNGSTATYVWFKFTEQPAFKTARQHWPDIYTTRYLNALQSYIERLQAKVEQVSKVNPSNPVFINYRKEKDGDFDPHLAKIDPGQIVTPPPDKRLGYVPVVISVYYPDDQSNNAKGGQKQKAPTLKCLNSAWTNTYHPYLNP